MSVFNIKCYIFLLIFRVTFENMTNVCELIQEAAINALEGPNPPGYVATFGNVSPETFGDWVYIWTKNKPPGSTVSTALRTCLSYITNKKVPIFDYKKVLIFLKYKKIGVF